MKPPLIILMLLISAGLVYLFFEPLISSGSGTQAAKETVKPDIFPSSTVSTAKKGSDKTAPAKKQEQSIMPPPAPGNKPVLAKKSQPKPSEKKQAQDNDEDPTKSYPIEDAEIYFVHPEQRYPGNLGGPPPMVFPDPDSL